MPYTEVMHKWKEGTLRSGGPKGPPVKSQSQAVAIMLSEKRAAQAGKKEYQSKKYQSGGEVKGKDTRPTLPGGDHIRTPLFKGEDPQMRNPLAKPPQSKPVTINPDGTVNIPEQAKGGPVKKQFRRGGHVDRDDDLPSNKAAIAQNVAETLANPTGRTGLAKGGAVEPTGGGWRRWGQGSRHPHG